MSTRDATLAPLSFPAASNSAPRLRRRRRSERATRPACEKRRSVTAPRHQSPRSQRRFRQGTSGQTHPLGIVEIDGRVVNVGLERTMGKQSDASRMVTVVVSFAANVTLHRAGQGVRIVFP